jgi:hypothetical protein
MNFKQALSILLANPVSVIKDGIRSQSELYHKNQIVAKFGIEQLPSIDLLDLFPNLDEELHNYSYLDGTSTIPDILLLKLLARKFPEGAYLEIGSWRGESIANVADVLSDCTSVTLSANEMRELNFGEEFIKVHGLFSKDHAQIKSVKANSFKLDFATLNKTFDLIFIDGDHTFEGVLNDTRKSYSVRKNENSVLVWHDYGFSPEKVRHSVLNAILEGIPREKHKHLYHVSNTMCAVYLENQSHPVSQCRFPSYPNKKFSLRISASKL